MRFIANWWKGKPSGSIACTKTVCKTFVKYSPTYWGKCECVSKFLNPSLLYQFLEDGVMPLRSMVAIFVSDELVLKYFLKIWVPRFTCVTVYCLIKYKVNINIFGEYSIQLTGFSTKSNLLVISNIFCMAHIRTFVHVFVCQLFVINFAWAGGLVGNKISLYGSLVLYLQLLSNAFGNWIHQHRSLENLIRCCYILFYFYIIVCLIYFWG